MSSLLCGRILNKNFAVIRDLINYGKNEVLNFFLYKDLVNRFLLGSNKEMYQNCAWIYHKLFLCRILLERYIPRDWHVTSIECLAEEQKIPRPGLEPTLFLLESCAPDCRGCYLWHHIQKSHQAWTSCRPDLYTAYYGRKHKILWFMEIALSN